MADYRVAWGHDAAYIDMDKIVPEPKASFVEPVEVNQGITGASHLQGYYLPLKWDMIEDEDTYIDLLILFNLSTNQEAEITIHAQNLRGYWFKFNATAHLPIPGVDFKRERGFIRDLTMHITDMVEIA